MLLVCSGLRFQEFRLFSLLAAALNLMCLFSPRRVLRSTCKGGHTAVYVVASLRTYRVHKIFPRNFHGSKLSENLQPPGVARVTDALVSYENRGARGRDWGGGFFALSTLFFLSVQVVPRGNTYLVFDEDHFFVHQTIMFHFFS